jgi:peptidoglycan/LPS O-acetylase OafA/YrhL
LTTILLTRALNLRFNTFYETISWSLLAEIVYYTIYPLLLLLRRKNITWITQITIGIFIGVGVAATNPSAGDYPSYGPWLNWLLALPCWLMGCAIADHVLQSETPMSDKIWRWRLAVFGASVICSTLRFHSPIGFPWSLNFFAIFASLWLVREIVYFRKFTPPATLEQAGSWSYSLYLTHGIGFAVFWYISWPNLGHLLNWCLQTIFILIVAFVFAIIVEFPSHHIARQLGRWFVHKLPLQPQTMSLTQDIIKFALQKINWRDSRPTSLLFLRVRRLLPGGDH